MKTSFNTHLVISISLLACVFATKLIADEATVWTKVQSNPETTIFAGYANELGLEDALNTRNLIIPWTLFVPNNDAFTTRYAWRHDGRDARYAWRHDGRNAWNARNAR